MDFTLKKKKKYLVTGGAGFIGSSLVHRLVKDGNFVRVLDNMSRGSADRLSDIYDNIEVINDDIRNPEAVNKSCKDIDCVCHLAYVNGTEFFYSKPDLVLDIGVRGMINILDACKNQGVKDFVLASSSEVYQSPDKIPTDETVPLVVPDPLNPRYSYGGGKIICELMAINYGRKHFKRTVIFRPHNVYGPEMGWEHVIPQFIIRMKKICSQNQNGKIQFPIQGSGEETRAFIFIDDFTEGLMKVIKKGEDLNIYHIGTTDEIPIKQVVAEISQYFDEEVTVAPGELAKGGTLRRCPDITKLKKLGFLPKTNFHEGVKITADWYRNNDKRAEVKK